MEIQAFQESRKAQLDDFMKQYEDLKTKYSASISAAIAERNVSAQQTLIQKVLDTNNSLSTLVKNIIGALTAGDSSVDTKTLNQLTADLIKYQQEYKELLQTNDQLQTLKMLQATSSGDLQTAVMMYNWYLIALGILCVVVVVLAIRAAWTTSLFTSVTKTFTGTGR
jgi:translation initiation factor 2B subunit (eIF-2B alpha/beta/delta family)